MAAELTKAGLDVVGLERGHTQHRGTAYWDDQKHDELRYAVRYELFQNTANETWTLRHNVQETRAADQAARLVPARDWSRRGGRALERSTWRYHPNDFTKRTSTIERYGASKIPAGMSIQDWGITYDELEPYYDKFEYMAGIAGKAGN